MKLAIIDQDGVVHVIVEEIEQYNLDKPTARTEIINEIVNTLDELE